MDFVRTCCLLVAMPVLAAGADVRDHLKAIENRYNRAQSLTLSFSEIYTASRRPARSENGTLYLRKPGRMRWEYADPAGKLFISDGKNAYLYTPGDAHAEKSRLKESDDMRAPLAFLLGKLDFEKEFKGFATANQADGTWVTAEPKSANAAYTKVEFLATAEGEIHRLRVTGQDGSRLEFNFSNEKLNPPIAPTLFAFQPPPGISVVEADR
jgi:outer membrane lipoprotein carrier protein